VVKGIRLLSPYQVGVINGVTGVLVRSSLFDSIGSSIFNATGAPDKAMLIDDIWISGHLASAQIPRWVVPMRPQHLLASPSENHLGQDKSAIDIDLRGGGTSRGSVASSLLAHFEHAWDSEVVFRGYWDGQPSWRGFIGSEYNFQIC